MLIDLYRFHHIDRETPFDEIWEAIQGLVQAGKIIYAGSSNFAGWHLARPTRRPAAAISSGWCRSRASTT